MLRDNLSLAIRLILVLTALQITIAGQELQDSQRKVVKDPEEYVVYDTLLNARYDRKAVRRFVISRNTASSEKNSSFIGLIGGITFSGAKRPEVDSETSADYDANYKETFVLANQFNLKIPYTLVTREELKTVFPIEEEGKPVDMECWNRFYKQYPESGGIVAFSRVGFNSKRDQALVYVASQSGFVGGSGWFVVLSRAAGGAWKIQKEVLVWLS